MTSVDSSARFSIRADRKLIRPRYRSNRFVIADIVTPPAPRTGTRPPVNLAFVLDRSGSMGGEKLRLATRAVEEGIGRLHAEDRFAIVVYDDVIDVVVPGTLATASARADALGRLRDVDARGTTNLGEGWLRGCEQVALALMKDGVNRCLLLSDGLANQGITDHAELARHAGQLRARGVSTSTFGVGDDFDEALLKAMADAGGGHFYDIATAAAIPDHINSEVGEALEVVAREATLEITAPQGVRVEALSAFPVTASGSRSQVLVGDLVSEQQVRVVLRFNFPYGEVGTGVPAVFTLSDRQGVLDGPGGQRLTWEYADDRSNDEQPRDREIDRIVAGAFSARARQAAVGLNRQGDYDGARKALEATARKIRGYAGKDPELRSIMDGLHSEAERFSRVMAERSRKEAFATAHYDLQSRTMSGQALRGASNRPTRAGSP